METLKAIYPDLMPFEAAAVGFSPFRCDNCGTHITKKNEAGSPIWHEVPLVECDLCEGDTHEGSITVTPSSAHLLSQDAVRETVWFHATYVEDWFEKISTGHGMEREDGDFLYVHVGSEDAARDIAKYKYFDGYSFSDEPIVMLYQVKLKTGAKLSSRVVNDNETWRDFGSVVEGSKEAIGGDAVRYLNRWESPGSISLLVDARQLELVGVEQIHNPRFNLPSELKKKLPQLGLSKMCA
jgi:hypothetical protein